MKGVSTRWNDTEITGYLSTGFFFGTSLLGSSELPGAFVGTSFFTGFFAEVVGIKLPLAKLLMS